MLHVWNQLIQFYCDKYGEEWTKNTQCYNFWDKKEHFKLVETHLY